MSDYKLEGLRQIAEGPPRKNYPEAYRPRAACRWAVAEIERLQRKRFTVSVFGATVADGQRKYTVECHGEDDAMLLAFALDGGWGRSEGSKTDASGMLELVKEYCEIIHMKAAEKAKGD